MRNFLLYALLWLSLAAYRNVLFRFPCSLFLLRLFTFTWVSSAAGKTLVVVEIVTTTQTQAPSLGLSHIPVKRATEQWG